jgi:hypothetical protein
MSAKLREIEEALREQRHVQVECAANYRRRSILPA